MRKLRAADLFCGAGGTSIGAEMSGAVETIFALNHWDLAIETHRANFPRCKHVNSRLDQTNPSECDAIDLLFASPACTHHSRARGGKPTSDQQRADAWDVMRWLEHHRPRFMVIENVWEFTEWGPVNNKTGIPIKSLKGKFFDAWLMAIRAAGYKLDYRSLNAADYNARTSRSRFFLIARKGNRSPVWPEPSHTETPGNSLPGMELPGWLPAADVIDWDVPCPSIFSRPKQLADNTLFRLEAGLRKFVAPFVLSTASGGAARFIWNPAPTFVANDSTYLAAPYITQWDNTSNKGACSRSVGDPLPTMLTKANMGIAMPFVMDANRKALQDSDHNRRLHELGTPLQAMTTKNGKALVIPWIPAYYGTDNQHGINESMATITTKGRHGLAVALCTGPGDWPAPQTEAMAKLQATMKELGVCDLGYRMLQNHELSAAQGFPDDYIFKGNKGEVTKQIGNSVSPPVAKAISLAIAG